LTGKIKRLEDLAINDYRRTVPRFQGDNLQMNLDVMKEIERIAGEKGCKASQLALAWLLAQGDDVVPIPGTKRRKYLQENVQAIDIKLTFEEVNRISGIAQNLVGNRYSDESMRMVNL